MGLPPVNFSNKNCLRRVSGIICWHLSLHRQPTVWGNRYPEEMRNSTRLSFSPGTHLWCQSNHRSNTGILLPTLGRATVNVQPSCPHYHNVHWLGIPIWPISAWYEAVELSLLSFHWWIALCACLEAPGDILVLSWPGQHFKYQFSWFVLHWIFKFLVPFVQSELSGIIYLQWAICYHLFWKH